MYSFGENEVYDQFPNPRGSWMRWFQDSLQRYTGVAPAIIMGRGVLQYSFGIVPYRRKIVTVGKLNFSIYYITLPKFILAVFYVNFISNDVSEIKVNN